MFIFITADLLWTAPELMENTCTIIGNLKGDVYSVGIIFNEIITREGVFHRSDSLYEAEGIQRGNVIDKQQRI